MSDALSVTDDFTPDADSCPRCEMDKLDCVCPEPLSSDLNVPAGVVALFVVEDRVIAQASDFNRSTPGGFTLREAQEHRVRVHLAHEVIRALASPLLSDNVDSYLAEQIVRKIPGQVHIVPVGGANK